MKDELAIIRALNRKHERVIIRLANRLAKVEAELKRLKMRRERHGRN